MLRRRHRKSWIVWLAGVVCRLSPIEIHSHMYKLASVNLWDGRLQHQLESPMCVNRYIPWPLVDNSKWCSTFRMIGTETTLFQRAPFAFLTNGMDCGWETSTSIVRLLTYGFCCRAMNKDTNVYVSSLPTINRASSECIQSRDQTLNISSLEGISTQPGISTALSTTHVMVCKHF